MTCPITLVTVRRAVEEIPISVFPTLGKIPLVLMNVNATIAIGSTETFTYLTLAGGCGGSLKTMDSP